MSWPPFQCPPTALQDICVAIAEKSGRLLSSTLGNKASHLPPVNVKLRSISGGPKSHCVVPTQVAVAIAYLRTACSHHRALEASLSFFGAAYVVYASRAN